MNISEFKKEYCKKCGQRRYCMDGDEEMINEEVNICLLEHISKWRD